MRPLISAFCLLILPVVVVPAQQKVAIHRAAAPNASVRLSGAFSSIRVIGWARDSIALTGVLGAGSHLDGGPTRGTGPVAGMKFYLEAPDDAALRGNRLELRVPAQARVWLKAGSADIEVSDVTGGLDLNIVGGSIRVAGEPRELLVESMDGGVTVQGAPAYARIKTATGDIVVDARLGDATLTTVSGTIQLNGGAVERGRFESVTGPITFAGDLPRAADVRFDTHSGAIDVRLPPGGFELDAITITGTIENRYSAARPVAGREGRGMELGTITGGASSGMRAPRVVVRSFKGNIRFAAR